MLEWHQTAVERQNPSFRLNAVYNCSLVNPSRMTATQNMKYVIYLKRFPDRPDIR
jgi:hypothetical protein